LAFGIIFLLFSSRANGGYTYSAHGRQISCPERMRLIFPMQGMSEAKSRASNWNLMRSEIAKPLSATSQADPRGNDPGVLDLVHSLSDLGHE
jgi:hypothetical protein